MPCVFQRAPAIFHVSEGEHLLNVMSEGEHLLNVMSVEEHLLNAMLHVERSSVTMGVTTACTASFPQPPGIP